MSRDRLVRLDDYLLSPDDIPSEGVLVLVFLPITEPRVPAILPVAGADLLLMWRLDTPDETLRAHLASIYEAGIQGVGVAAIDRDSAQVVMCDSPRALHLLDAPVSTRLVLTHIECSR